MRALRPSMLPLLDLMMSGMGILCFVALGLLLAPPADSGQEERATRFDGAEKPAWVIPSLLECAGGSVLLPEENRALTGEPRALARHFVALAERNRTRARAGDARREFILLLLRPSCVSGSPSTYERLDSALTRFPLIYKIQPVLEGERIDYASFREAR